MWKSGAQVLLVERMTICHNGLTIELYYIDLQIKVKKKPVVKLIVQTSFAAKIKAESGSVTFQFQNIFSSMADFRDVNAAMQPE